MGKLRGTEESEVHLEHTLCTWVEIRVQILMFLKIIGLKHGLKIIGVFWLGCFVCLFVFWCAQNCLGLGRAESLHVCLFWSQHCRNRWGRHCNLVSPLWDWRNPDTGPQYHMGLRFLFLAKKGVSAFYIVGQLLQELLNSESSFLELSDQSWVCYYLS